MASSERIANKVASSPLPPLRTLLASAASRSASERVALLAASARANNDAQRLISLQAWAMGYFAKISSTRLNAFSAAASGVMPPWMMSIQPCIQTCSFWTWA